MNKDIKDYIKFCVICQSLHKNKPKKPSIMQIIAKGPWEPYVTDLINVTPDIDDKKKVY